MAPPTTFPDNEPPSVPRLHAHRVTDSLVVICCATDPSRVGEVVPVPERGTHILGRGGDLEVDAFPRLALHRLRPGRIERRPPLEVPTLSRQALLVRRTAGGIEVENQGKAQLRVNGASTDRRTLTPGDVIELGSQLMLLLVARPELPQGANDYPEFPFGSADPFGIVGESPAAWSMRARLAFVAKRGGHLLIRGASGTGKELAATAVHRMSSSARGPLVARNAATLPEGLVDAELFGCARGYPNHGAPERVGLIGAADGGTLLLDEFAELPSALQTHLLRVLDQGEYHRLGETSARTSRFRLIGATNRPLDQLRDDIVARFSFQVELPPLVERPDDIPLLIQHVLAGISRHDDELTARFFVDGAARIRPRFLRLLVGLDFPTNLRQLRNLLLASLAESIGDTLEVPAALDAMDDRPLPPPTPSKVAPAEPAVLTPARIQAVLDANNGRLEESRVALGLSSRFALSRLIKRHGLVIRKRPG